MVYAPTKEWRKVIMEEEGHSVVDMLMSGDLIKVS